jgi:glutathione S-transferase
LANHFHGWIRRWILALDIGLLACLIYIAARKLREERLMKLHDFAGAPSSQRVRVFLAEKGLELDMPQLNVREGAQFEEPFTTMNPFHCVPFLELDDGTIIAESVSICRYLEELHPEPSLFGATPETRATIDMWNRRIELDGFMPILHALRNRLPAFAGRVVPGTRLEIPQMPEMVTRGQEMMTVFLDRVEPGMASRAFIAGDSISIADITGFFTLRMAGAIEMDIGGSWPNMARWFGEVSARPGFAL